MPEPGDQNTGLYQRLMALRDVRRSAPVRRRAPSGDVQELIATPAQAAVWFGDRATRGSAAHNMTVARRIASRVDVGALEAALADVIDRHQALRTTFDLRDGAVTQIVHPRGAASLERSSLAALPSHRREDLARAACEAHAALSIDLAAGPLLAAKLVELAADDHVLVLRTHHACADGASLAILCEDLAERYQHHLGASTAQTPQAEGAGMADYTAWLGEWMNGEEHRAQLRFWRGELGGASAVMPLPTDRPWPRVMTWTGGQVSHEAPGDLVLALNELARATDTTLQMALLAALLLLLARYTGQSDVHVTLPVAGRFRPNLERTVGLVANRVAIRDVVGPETTFLEVLSRIRGRFLDALDHHDIPFESVVDDLHPKRHGAVAPFGQVMLQYLRRRPDSSGGLHWPAFAFEPRFALTPLHIGVVDDGSLVVHVRYSADLYERSTAERIAAEYASALQRCAGDPAVRVGALTVKRPGGAHAPAPVGTSTASARASTAPRTSTEQTLLAIWRRILGRQDIAIGDDFFESGGNSLSALQLLSAVEQELGVRLPLPRMFEMPTVEAMAMAIDGV